MTCMTNLREIVETLMEGDYPDCGLTVERLISKLENHGTIHDDGSRCQAHEDKFIDEDIVNMVCFFFGTIAGTERTLKSLTDIVTPPAGSVMNMKLRIVEDK